MSSEPPTREEQNERLRQVVEAILANCHNRISACALNRNQILTRLREALR